METLYPLWWKPLGSGAAALEAAGLCRGRPAVIENFKPTFIDEERDKDLGHHGVRTTMYSSYSSASTAAEAAALGGASGADDAAGGKINQSNGVVGNGAAGGSDDVSSFFVYSFGGCFLVLADESKRLCGATVGNRVVCVTAACLWFR